MHCIIILQQIHPAMDCLWINGLEKKIKNLTRRGKKRRQELFYQVFLVMVINIYKLSIIDTSITNKIDICNELET